jgi:hypothetical protein
MALFSHNPSTDYTDAFCVICFRIDGGKIVEAEIIVKPDRLQQLDLGVVE